MCFYRFLLLVRSGKLQEGFFLYLLVLGCFWVRIILTQHWTQGQNQGHRWCDSDPGHSGPAVSSLHYCRASGFPGISLSRTRGLVIIGKRWVSAGLGAGDHLGEPVEGFGKVCPADWDLFPGCWVSAIVSASEIHSALPGHTRGVGTPSEKETCARVLGTEEGSKFSCVCVCVCTLLSAQNCCAQVASLG